MSRNRPSPRALQAWRAFLETHARVVLRLERDLDTEIDLPLAWYDVLVQLSEAPSRSLRMQELAKAVLLSKSGLTRLVDRMEAEGLVTRSPASTDRRGIIVTMTDTGFESLKHAAPVHLAGVQDYFAIHIHEDELEVVSRVLRRIADANYPQPERTITSRTGTRRVI